LEYRIQENRAFFICLFKHIIYIGERGCTRTALEFCKVLLSLDPIDDPLAILLLLDYYAIRSEEYNYLIRFYTEENQRLNLDGLPNFAYSLSLAYFRLSLFDKANEILQNALLRFPTMLKYLLDKLSIKPDRSVEKCRFFSDSERYETNALKCVQQLYIVRMSSEWKEKDELDFLRNNVNEVIQLIDLNQDSRIVNYTKL
jgi:tetratricopeptide (TPR) repeat protein